MYGQDIVRRPLKNMSVSATLKKRMDFYEVTGGPRRTPRPELGSKARPSQRALSFPNLLINWMLGEEHKPIITRDADKTLHLQPQVTVSNFCMDVPFHALSIVKSEDLTPMFFR